MNLDGSQHKDHSRHKQYPGANKSSTHDQDTTTINTFANQLGNQPNNRSLGILPNVQVLKKMSWSILICITSVDPELEAFIHYPTEGSFAALMAQLTTFTNSLNKLFLSY